MDFRLSRFNPLRPVDWRYQRVCKLLADQKLPSRSLDDPPTKRLYRFLATCQSCDGDEAERALMAEQPALLQAWGIYNDCNGTLSDIIKARLLASGSYAEVAKKIGVATSVVSHFAESFFDVHDRLDREDFILGSVLNENSAGSGETSDRSLLLMRVGYLSGPDALDQILGGGAKQNAEEGPSRRLHSYLRGLVQHKALQAMARLDPGNGASARDILAAYVRLQALSGDEPAESPLQAELIKTAEELFRNLHWEIGYEGAPPELKPWYETAVELRSREMAMVSAGKQLPNEAELKSLSLQSGSGR